MNIKDQYTCFQHTTMLSNGLRNLYLTSDFVVWISQCRDSSWISTYISPSRSKENYKNIRETQCCRQISFRNRQEATLYSAWESEVLSIWLQLWKRIQFILFYHFWTVWYFACVCQFQRCLWQLQHISFSFIKMHKCVVALLFKKSHILNTFIKGLRYLLYIFTCNTQFNIYYFQHSYFQFN